MPMRRMLVGGVFRPDEIDELVAAFDSTLAALNLVDRSDPLATLVAEAIIDCAKKGAIERGWLRDCAVEVVTRR